MSARKAVDLTNNEEAIMEARKAALAQLGGSAGGVQISSEARSFVLPDGREVTMAPPSGGIIRKVATILGDSESNLGLMMLWAKAMLYVRSVDGSPMPSINSIVDAQKVADILGGQGEEIVMNAYSEFWPPMSVKDLPTIKK